MGSDIKRHFDQRALAYDETQLWVRDQLVLDTTIDFLDLASHLRMLDVGAGTGVVVDKALEVCPDLQSCVAVDVSERMLSHIKHPRVQKYCQDAQDLPFPESSFDVVLCRQSLHYLRDVHQGIMEIHRVLAAHGILVIGQITPFSEADESYWKEITRTRQPLRQHMLTLHDLIEIVTKSSFKIVRVSQFPVRESLNSLLSRYNESDAHMQVVRRMFENAPDTYRLVHSFHECTGNIHTQEYRDTGPGEVFIWR